ncbi:MAG: PspA/IM30 family protein [Candidatus Promineifilaceae bacterium]|nr:PspA/IM30 family protein [Candidatus Promineifilaceae bacterium]
MSNQISRLILLIKTRLHGLFAPAADPRQSFIYTYERQANLLRQVQRALSEIGKAKARLLKKADDLRARTPELESAARACLQRGREDLARLTLQRRQLALVELRELERQLGKIEQEEQRLSLTEQRLSTQLEAFYARQEFIAARHSAAEAQVQIGQALSGVSTELAQLSLEMEAAERQSEQMQARAAAIDRLVGEGWLKVPGTAGDVVEARLEELEVSKEVDAQLALLKAEIAG